MSGERDDGGRTSSEGRGSNSSNAPSPAPAPPPPHRADGTAMLVVDEEEILILAPRLAALALAPPPPPPPNSNGSPRTHAQSAEASGKERPKPGKKKKARKVRIPESVVRSPPAEGKHAQHPGLPQIYATDLRSRLVAAVADTTGSSVIVLCAPTGFGKTVLVHDVMSELSPAGFGAGVSVLPYRVSVKHMWSYLGVLFPDRSFGYAMRGDKTRDAHNSTVLMTVGYFLEVFLGSYRRVSKFQPALYMVDEAHDTSFQTDLALRTLLYAQRVRPSSKFKLVISSATLDIRSTLRGANISPPPVILQVKDREANVKVVFAADVQLGLEVQFAQVRKQLIAMVVRTIREDILQSATDPAIASSRDNILVIVPGSREVEDVVLALETELSGRPGGGFLVLPLHAKLSREEIEFATQNHPVRAAATGDQQPRRIIVSTNMVENAITLDINFMIDMGFRKTNVTFEDGVTALKTVRAAQSSLVQAKGRVGRRGACGYAFLLISREEFDLLPEFPENEVDRNPPYAQILKLVASNLPVKEVLCHIDPARIERAVDVLRRLGCLEEGEVEETKGSPSWSLSSFGHLVAGFSFSLRASVFLARMLSSCSASVWYAGVICACWVDSDERGVFHRPARKPLEPMDDYNDRLRELGESQAEFFEVDCLRTMLRVWFESWCFEERGFAGSFDKWCASHGLSDKTLRLMHRDSTAAFQLLAGLGYRVKEPSSQECLQWVSRPEQMNALVDGLMPALLPTFRDWAFSYVAAGKGEGRGGRPPTYVWEDDAKSHMTVQLDGSAGKNASSRSKTYPPRLLALSVRKVEAKNVIALGKTVAIPGEPRLPKTTNKSFAEVRPGFVPMEALWSNAKGRVRRRRIYMDALNFVERRFFVDGWDVSHARERVRAFVDACRDAGFEVVVFVDDARSGEAHDKWRQRTLHQVMSASAVSPAKVSPVAAASVESGDEDEDVVQPAGVVALPTVVPGRRVPLRIERIMCELFQGVGVEVRLSQEANNDDTLAYYAAQDGAFVFSEDRDFFRYRVENHDVLAFPEIVSDFDVVAPSLVVKTRSYDPYDHRNASVVILSSSSLGNDHRRTSFAPGAWTGSSSSSAHARIASPPRYRVFDLDGPPQTTRDPDLATVKIFRKGVASPLPSTLQDNPYIVVRPLRRELFAYSRTAKAPGLRAPNLVEVVEEIPVWDAEAGRATFSVQTVSIPPRRDGRADEEEDISLLRDSPRKVFAKYFSREASGLGEGDLGVLWTRHVHCCRAIVVEMHCWLREMDGELGVSYVRELLRAEEW